MNSVAGENLVMCQFPLQIHTHTKMMTSDWFSFECLTAIFPCCSEPCPQDLLPSLYPSGLMSIFFWLAKISRAINDYLRQEMTNRVVKWHFDIQVGEDHEEKSFKLLPTGFKNAADN